jgi:hypothetical protein
VLRKGDYLARSDDAAVLAALASGARDPANPRGFRLALLHLLAAHPGADGALVELASFIGFELPRFDDAMRDELVAACRAMR